jgi:parallel beta-helix repeat protein
MMKNRFSFLALLLLSTLQLQPSVFAQGSLTPASAPAPMMKTLDQIEARTPIDAAHTPGDASNQFIISAPGSYYLTGNITGVSGKNGIWINADNVTLNLNGFALIGTLGTLNGITGPIFTIPVSHRNLRVYNGTVDFWYGSGIDCQGASNSQFDHLRVSQNNGYGLICGDGSVLSSCSAEANGFQGLATGNRSSLTGCTSADNGFDGIDTGNYCTIAACTSSGNLDLYAGINTGGNCTVTACCANDNYDGIVSFDGSTVRDCTANGNAEDGIIITSGAVVVNCTASFNSTNGISCVSGCLISGNNAFYNLNGIRIFGSLNRIDGNTANYNSHVGILWLNDVVIRNNAFLNASANYSPAVGTGNTGPLNAAGTSTSPWANF